MPIYEKLMNNQLRNTLIACTKFQMAIAKVKSKKEINIMTVRKKEFSLTEMVFDTKNADVTKKIKKTRPKMNGTKCEIKARFACVRTASSLLMKNMSNGTMNGAKKMLK